MRTTLAAAVLLALPVVARADAIITLGDSLGWGFNPSDPAAFDPSYGDHTWVASWADRLAGRLGGRPQVHNLAVPGEMAPTIAAGGGPAYSFNLNYDAENPGSQLGKLQERLGDLRAQGERVEAVAFAFGGTDVLGLMANPDYLWGTQQRRDQLLNAMLADFRLAYGTILTTLQENAPGAEIILLNAHNPANAYLHDDETWNDEYAPLAEYALLALNAEIAGMASAYGARLVDVYSAFLGREHLLTNMPGLEDPHPNAAGYDLIAQLVIPAPGALALFGAAGLGAARRRR